jgi:hypothetical protein
MNFSTRGALECGCGATAFIGREAPRGNAYYRCLIRLPWSETRAPREAKAVASLPHSKVPRSLRNPGLDPMEFILLSTEIVPRQPKNSNADNI